MKLRASIAALFFSLGLAACSEPQAEATLAKEAKAIPAESTATPEQTVAAEAMVPAIIFLQFLNQQAPVLLCQQDAGIACLNMPLELCQASVGQASERCGPKLLEQWPAQFAETEANAIAYSQAYRNCMLADWVTEFGLQPERLSACGIELTQ